MVPPFVSDRRTDLDAWARALGVCREAVELHASGDLIDLHIDTFIWTRLIGYDLTRRHGRGLLGARGYSQADLPRLVEAGVTGGVWCITTNPLRSAEGRGQALKRNLARLQSILSGRDVPAHIVRTADEYRAARRAGVHGVFVGVQGGNALGPGHRVLDELPPWSLLLVTLVHLTDSEIGCTSSPLRLGPDRGLLPAGRELVRRLNHARVFVDLAHLSRPAFWNAVEVHDPTLPLMVSHTGVCGRHPHWRNLDDEQLRRVADSGGTVGVIYHTGFLGRPRSLTTIVDHLAYIVSTVGEDHASLGSDWDGSIPPPRDMPTCLELPRLTHEMLRRGWSPERIQKILGHNFLRVLRQLRD